MRKLDNTHSGRRKPHENPTKNPTKNPTQNPSKNSTKKPRLPVEDSSKKPLVCID